jgi:hypothetical protein
MKLVSRAVLLSSLVAVPFAAPASAADPGVTFVGRGFVAGDILDRARSTAGPTSRTRTVSTSCTST